MQIIFHKKERQAEMVGKQDAEEINFSREGGSGENSIIRNEVCGSHENYATPSRKVPLG
jgi:hypothetical protein